MRRSRRGQHYTLDNDEDSPVTETTTAGRKSQPRLLNGDVDNSDFLQMERLVREDGLGHGRKQTHHRFENTIEAKVEVGDTLQALALRFHCTVAEIKRLNKIDKENEIHARKVIKIPLTVHSVLLGAPLPTVHTSGSNSPKQSPHGETTTAANEATTEKLGVRNTLEEARVMLGEKLLVASVNASGGEGADSSINSVILNSEMKGRTPTVYTDDTGVLHSSIVASERMGVDAVSSPLLQDMDAVPRVRPIRGPSIRAIDWSGSDCDMNWVCLFVVIMALCFAIPLIYVIYIAEHAHSHNQTSH